MRIWDKKDVVEYKPFSAALYLAQNVYGANPVGAVEPSTLFSGGPK